MNSIISDYATGLCSLHGVDDKIAMWHENVRALSARVTRIVPAGHTFALVDEEQVRSDLAGFLAVPFPGGDSGYAGDPDCDATAIAELERQRRAGVEFLVFAWPSFWWRDCYPKFFSLLRRSLPA